MHYSFSMYQTKSSIDDLYALHKLLSFILLILLNIKNVESLKSIIEDKDMFIISLLKDMLIYFTSPSRKSSDEKRIATIIIIACVCDFKKKLLLNNNNVFYKELYQQLFKQIIFIYKDAFPLFIAAPHYHTFMNDVMKCTFKHDAMLKYNKQHTLPHFHHLCESIIILSLSKEKYGYKKNSTFSLVTFISNAVSQHIKETKEQFGDLHTSLFRKDDISNILLKYMFIMFGNVCFVNAFYLPIKKYVDMFEKDFISDDKYPHDNFDMFYNEFITQMKIHFPLILKYIVAITYQEVIKEYDLGNDNYAPLFTEIVFNFFISPKIQDMYDIGLLKYKSMKHINRIIRNICFNMEFPQDDKCWLFNEKLKEQNRMITSFIKDDIIDKLMNDIKENKVEEILQCEMNGDMFGYPICLYSAAWKSVEKHLDIKDLMS